MGCVRLRPYIYIYYSTLVINIVDHWLHGVVESDNTEHPLRFSSGGKTKAQLIEPNRPLRAFEPSGSLSDGCPPPPVGVGAS